MGAIWVMCKGFFGGWWKCFVTYIGGSWKNTVNILNAIELYTLKTHFKKYRFDSVLKNA